MIAFSIRQYFTHFFTVYLNTICLKTLDDTFDDDSPPDISRTLVKSFIAVVTGILLATFGYFLLVVIAIMLFFPETRSELTRQRAPEETQLQIELPGRLLLFCPLLQALTAAAGGYVAARFAPMAPKGHAGMVAGFLVLTSVQMLLKNDGPLPEWLVAINTIGGPACAMWGASKVKGSHKELTDDSEGSEDLDSDGLDSEKL